MENPFLAPLNNPEQAAPENPFTKPLPAMSAYEPGMIERASDFLFPHNPYKASNELAARDIAKEKGLSVEGVYQQAGGSRDAINPEGRSKSRAFVEGVSVVAPQVADIGPAAVNTVLRTIRGTDESVERSFLDKAIDYTKVDLKTNQHDPNYSNLYGIGESIGYSLSTMGATALAAAGATAATGNPLAGAAAGMSASGTVAYRASKDQFVDRVRDAFRQTHKREPNQEEWDKLREDTDSAAIKYGAWEAIPESVGNLIFVKAVSAPLKGMTKSAKLKEIANRILSVQLSEQTTELATGVGQNRAEYEAGLTKEKPTAGEIFKKQAANVGLTTLAMGAAGSGAKAAYGATPAGKRRNAFNALNQDVDDRGYSVGSDEVAVSALDPNRHIDAPVQTETTSENPFTQPIHEQQPGQDSSAKISTHEDEEPIVTERAEAAENATGIYRVNVDDIQVDPEQYQFRTKVNKDGVDNRLDGIEKWDDRRAGVVSVHRRNDGSMYVADGHHRIDLAKRLKQGSLNARFFDEKEGWTVEEVRTEAAMDNIANDKADPLDVAKVIRNSGMDAKDIRKKNNLPNTQTVKDGQSLAKLNDNTFGLVVNGQLNEKDGAAIGDVFEVEQQDAAASIFQKVKPDTTYQRHLLVNEINAAEFAKTQGEQGGLFGDDPQEISLMQNRLKVLDSLRAQLNIDKRLFKSLNTNADKASEAGNKIAKSANEEITKQSQKSLDLISRVATTPALNEMVNKAAKRVHDGESLSNVSKELKQELRNYEQTESGGLGQDSRVEQHNESGQQADTGRVHSRPGEQISEGDADGSDNRGQHGAREQEPQEQVESDLLTSYTEQDLQQKASNQQEQEKSQAQAEKKAEAKEKADKQVDSFSLTGSDRQRDENPNQGDIFDVDKSTGQQGDKAEHKKSSAKDKKSSPPKSKLDQTADSIDAEIDSVAAELAELLKAQASKLNSGVDPAILALGAKLGALYVSKGVVKFAQYSQAILNKLKELGVDADQVKPALKEFYAASQAQVSDELFDQMDDMRTVRKFDLDSLDATVATQSSTVAPVASVAVANAQTLDDFIYSRMDQINDNRALKKAIAEYEGIKPSDVTDKQMKKGQEAMELALVRNARDIVAKDDNDLSTFTDLLIAYKEQPNLNVRSSTSMKNQAYSTPAPVAFLASRMAGIDKSSTVYEPTAGNGMLLLAANPETAVANELEDLRVSQLKQLGFQVTQKDATKHSPGKNSYDAAIMNPPFGKLKNPDGTIAPVKFDDYTLKSIDHLITAKALEAIKDDGKASIIIGASKKAGEIGSSDRVFFNWLYSHYNVVDHFEVDGKLYNRQGAGWPIRVITVHGRNETETLAPKSGSIERFSEWGEIYEHFKLGLDSEGRFIGSRTESVGSASTEVASDGLTNNEELSGRQTGSADSRVGRSDTTGTRDSTGLGKRGDVQSGARSSRSASNDGQSKRDPEQSGTDTTQDNDGRRADAKKPDTRKPSERSDSKPKPVSSSSFQTTYQARSQGFNDSVLTPNNMALPLQQSFDNIQKEVGDFDSYVMDKLGYSSTEDLHKAFMGLQVDAVAATIYNFERKKKGVIIADQTGVGKGRQAAAIIRYAIREGKTPIFVTVTENLFTDMYDDLADIGSDNVRPLILNSGSGITRKDGNRLFTNANSKKHLATLEELAKSKTLPEDRNALFLTYSQINKPNVQRELVAALSKDAIFVLDESHNAAGEQESFKKVGGVTRKQRTTSGFISDIILDKPVAYLSATYAKRPDNMPIYYRTDLMDAVDKPSELVDALAAGGVPMQSIMSGMLSRSGQLIRRERSFEGISIPVVFDAANRAAHTKISDQVTSGLRAVTHADTMFHEVFMEDYKEQVEKIGASISAAGNQAATTIDHSNFNAIVHNYVRQLLLSLKAEQAAMKAIDTFKSNKKPIIALENTMGSFLEEYAKDAGLKVGDVIDADYRDVMLRALDRTRRLSLKDKKGNKTPIDIPLSKLDPVTRHAYKDAQELIESLDLDEFPISPIDFMRHKMKEAGLSVAELTGRELMIDYSGSKPVLARRPKTESNKRATVNTFNGGTLDALIINKSGSTGLSIHASEKFTDQRPRHMIVAQTMLDVNILVQMLGRINRTGQVELPTYELMGLDIPAEKRPLASSSRKLKSLNANTSANEESDSSLNVPDMYNKYGDQVVARFLSENAEIAKKVNMSSPVGDNPEDQAYPGMAMKFTGRMALLDVKQQESIYAQIEPAYSEKIDYLTKTGQNELIASTLDTDAKILTSKIVYEGKKPGTVFGGDTTLHKVSIKLQGNPPTAEDVQKELSRKLKKGTAEAQLDAIIDERKVDEQKMKDLIDARIEKAFQDAAEYSTNPNAKQDKLKTLQDKESDLRATSEKYHTHIARMRGLLRQFAIGNAVKLDIGDDVVTGVVTDIVDRHKGLGDPWASSKTSVRFMVNSGIRSIDIPLSNLNMASGIASEHIKAPNLERIFDQQIDTNARELRYIATGNLIAGSAKLKGGRIVNFTDEKGKTHQGIMMPKKYGKEGEFDSSDTDTNFSIRDTKIATKFLRENQEKLEFAGGIFNATQSVRISSDKKGWHVQVPKSNKDSDGWKVKFDESLLKLTGDFYGSGKTMKAYFGDAKLKRVVERVMSLTSLHALPSMRDAWVNAGGNEKAEASKSFDDVPGGSRFSLAGSNSNPSSSGNRTPISKLEADKVIDRITGLWRRGRKDVELVSSFSELPADIQKDAHDQGASEKDVRGVFQHGKLYLVRDNHQTAADLETTIFHEAYGHYGLRALFGQNIETMLNALFVSIGGSKGLNRIAQENKIDLTEYAKGLSGANYTRQVRNSIMMEELLAHMAENQKPSIKRKVKELIGAVRQWLRDKGFIELAKYNESDLLHLLAQSKDAVIKGKAADGKAGGSSKFMVAYHGTPHKFDKFSLDAMGSGEGAQAYGWGMYFAGKKEVAEYYRDTLTGDPAHTLKGMLQQKFPELSDAAARGMSSAITYYAESESNAVDRGYNHSAENRDYIESNREEIEAFLSTVDFSKIKGNLYQVDIPEDHELLSWDKPLSDQPEAIQSAVNSLNIASPRVEKMSREELIKQLQYNDPNGVYDDESSIAEFGAPATKEELLEIAESQDLQEYLDEQTDMSLTGQSLYKSLVAKFGGGNAMSNDAQQKASEALNEAGIKGLRYLDNDSRNKPLNDIKNEFLQELPEDADIDDAIEALEDGVFSEKNAALVRGLIDSDWLGFDYPSQAISAALGRNIQDWDPSSSLLDAVRDAQTGGTNNYVIWDESAVTVEAVNDELHQAKTNRPAVFSRRQSLPETAAQARLKTFFEGIKHQPIDRMFRVPFDVAGLVDSHGRLKGSVTLNEKTKQVIKKWTPHDNDNFNWMDNVLEVARHGLIDRYKLTDEYKTRFREAEALGRNIDMQALDILKKLEENGVQGAESAVLHKMLTGEKIEGHHLNSLATPILRAIDDLGLMAVEYGVITREQFERNRGEYLHRSYLKHEGTFTSLGKWLMDRQTKHARKIQGKASKGRGIEIKVSMDRLVKHTPKDWYGQKLTGGPDMQALNGKKFMVLENPGVVPHYSETLEGMEPQENNRTVETIYWPTELPRPAKYEAYRERGKFEVRRKQKGKVVLWRDYTKAERENMGEIIDARYNIAKTFQVISHDIAMGKFFHDVAQNDEWFVRELLPNENALSANEARSLRNLSKTDWVQVPDSIVSHSAGTKQWGALAGGYVRAEIWRDLTELDKMNNPGMWRKVLTQWKLNKTARSPVVHMNNVMSNVMFMDLADVRMSDLIAGIKSYKAHDEHRRAAEEHGAFEGTFANEELRRKVMEPILDALAKQSMDAAPTAENALIQVSNIIGKAWTLLKKADQNMVEFYQVEDELFRMATYMRRIGLGDTPQEAARIAREQFLDYDIRAPWVNAARRTVLPFISYTYRAVPVLYQAITERPWKLAKYMFMAHVAMALSYAIEPGDEDEEYRTMREDQQGRTWLGTPRLMRMPYRDEHGNPVFIDIRRWIPAGDIFDMNQGNSAIPIPAPIQFGGPLMLAFEFALNKQAFTGKEIVGRDTDTISEAVSKSTDWLYKSWMPSAAYIPGSYYWDKAKTAWNGGRDILGRPYSFPQAMLSSIGIKVQPHDVRLGYSFRSRDLAAQARVISGDVRRAEMDLKREIISKAEYNKIMASSRKKIVLLDEKQKELRGR